MKNKLETMAVISAGTLITALGIAVLCAFSAFIYNSYTEFKERQMCIKLGGIPSSYSCESSKSSFKKINVYTGEEQEK